MFLLVRLTDVVEVEPAYFSPEFQPDRVQNLRAPKDDLYAPVCEDLLWHRISERYVGKVIPESGLCVAVADLVSYSNSVIRGGDGSSWTTVTFEVVVLRPEIHERIRAKIVRQSEKGIYLSVELFDGIFVPAHALVQPSVFDVVSGVWNLQITDDDAESGVSTLIGCNEYKTNDEVIVAITEVVVRSAVDHLCSADALTSESRRDGSIQPMSVTGSFADTGLGPCAWYE